MFTTRSDKVRNSHVYFMDRSSLHVNESTTLYVMCYSSFVLLVSSHYISFILVGLSFLPCLGKNLFGTPSHMVHLLSHLRFLSPTVSHCLSSETKSKHTIHTFRMSPDKDNLELPMVYHKRKIGFILPFDNTSKFKLST